MTVFHFARAGGVAAPTPAGAARTGGRGRTVFHFARATLRDGTPLPQAGEELPERCVILCKSGWHGSERAIDALTYAPGPNVALRELYGTFCGDEDKVCASHCRMLTGYHDASDLLREFAIWCSDRAGEPACAACAREPDRTARPARTACAACAREPARTARNYASYAVFTRAWPTTREAERAAHEEWLAPRLRALLGVAE